MHEESRNLQVCSIEGLSGSGGLWVILGPGEVSFRKKPLSDTEQAGHGLSAKSSPRLLCHSGSLFKAAFSMVYVTFTERVSQTLL
jgi:hypothetical protein